MDAVTPLTLSGRRVRLEPLSLSHTDALVRAASIDRATFGWTQVPEANGVAMTAYISAALEHQREGRDLPFAVVDAAREVVVGSTRYTSIHRYPWPEGSPDARPVDSVEIGWTWLSSEVQRTGINTEMKYLMLRHAFEVWRVHRLWLKTDSRNERSRRAIAGLGAVFEGVLRSESPGRGWEAAAVGGVRDTAVFSVIEGEWPSVRAGLERKLGA